LFITAILIISVEAVVYIILQFWTFADHDYYTIDMFILPILVVVCSFDTIKTHFGKIFNSILLKIIFSIFLLYNIYYASQKIEKRYNELSNGFSENKDLYTITPYLRQIGVLSTDTVISIPDNSHTSLYLMNQKGWTEYTDMRFNKGDHIRYNQDRTGITGSINKGAKYLIINGIRELYNKPYLQSFCTHLVGRYNNILIFNLKNKEKNFNIKERAIDKIYSCNAELLNENRKYFICNSDSSFLFQNGETVSDEFSRSGKYSCKLNKQSPYGMTIELNNFKIGESLAISVWKKSNRKTQSGIIISSNPIKYYNNTCKIIEKDSTGWEKIYAEIFITSELAGQKIRIYLYNPDPETTYFDDMEIIKYRCVIDN
jgi:hypothetical protein